MWLNENMRWIYLSPHLDDAVLSAGGLIYEQAQAGIPVEIWTIMCGYPPIGEVSAFAEFQHQQWGFGSAEEAMRARREEDQNAAAILGAQAVHFDFLDCIYRRGSRANGYILISTCLLIRKTRNFQDGSQMRCLNASYQTILWLPSWRLALMWTMSLSDRRLSCSVDLCTMLLMYLIYSIN